MTGTTDTRITVTTRSGRELHAANAGSSVTRCGRWLKTDASYFKVADGFERVTCEKCLQSIAAFAGDPVAS